jgi:predicted RNase H-like HicB family nuclease
MTPKYSLIIRWSEEDQCYIAWIPEFGPGVKTHGDTYEEAARMGQEIIELMMETGEQSEALPEPWFYLDPEVDNGIGKKLFPDNRAYLAPTIVPNKVRVKNATA